MMIFIIDKKANSFAPWKWGRGFESVQTILMKYEILSDSERSKESNH